MITEKRVAQPEWRGAELIETPRCITSRTWVWAVPLGLILLAALAVRLIGVWYGYPFLLEVDETVVYRATVRMMAAHSFDPHFYYYGPLLIYIEVLWLLPYLAVHALASHPGIPSVTSYNSWTATTSDPVMHVYGRLPFVLMGAASVYLAFLVGRRLGGTWAGLLAAAFLALSPLHAYQSHFLLANAPTSFFALLAVLLTMRHLDAGEPLGAQRGRWPWARLHRLSGSEDGWLIAAVIAASLGASIKYNAVVLLLIPLLSVFMESEQGYKSRFRRCVRLCVLAGLVFLVVTPPAITNTLTFAHDAAFQLKHYTRTGGGDATPSFIWNARYLIENEGLLLFPAAVAGLGILVWRQRRKADILLLTTIVVYYALLSVQRAHYDRNLLVILPLLSVSCAYVLVRLARAAKPVGLLLSGVMASVVLGSLAVQTVDQTRAFTATPSQITAYTWLDRHLPLHAHLLADGYTVPRLDRADVTMTYITDVRLSPAQLRRRRIDYAVIAKSLPYYQAAIHRSSSDASLRQIYETGGIVVYRVVKHGS